jgi:endonuclease/exonuclease/phosphatase (EEP) superfamily protein YafD
MIIKPSERVLNLICRIALALFSLALVCSTAIPLIHTDQGWVRVFDFPRVQISVLIGLALAAYVALSFWRRMRIWEYALAALVVLSLIWQLIAIAPYTALYRNEMSESRQENDSNRISLLVYNVRYDNREVKALLKLIRDNDPDLILLSEPTRWWFEKLKGLEDNYPHTIYQPQENHYGMLLFSKLELEKPEVRFLIEPEIPSFRTKVRLPSGTPITFYGVHPRPPGLDLPEEEENEGDDERADSDMRDAELMLVAKEIKELGETPVIVAGDFNDVAWSHTTHLFQRTGAYSIRV